MTEGKSRPGYRDAVRVMLAVLIGMLAGGAFNAALGEQGADTPAFVLIGGVLGLGGVIVAQVRRRRQEAQDD
jgi:purine-cytosine permease-like protein